MTELAIAFEDIQGMQDLARVGGKNASLAEMIRHLASQGVPVPTGFATTVEAFHNFLQQDGLAGRIHRSLAELNVGDVHALAAAGKQIRLWVMDTPLPDEFETAVREHWQRLTADEDPATFSVAVRSSATAEDLPDASFAGQQETYLNVCGIDAVLIAIHKVFASLYTDRAIAYRVHQGFEHELVGLSAGIQRMVRSDCGASGVMFSLDTESGFRDAALITGAWGLGETVVQGAVNPDEFYVYKPNVEQSRPAILRRTLGSKAIKMIYADDAVQTVDVDTSDRERFCINDEEVEQLARLTITIEKHYGKPMDIEWAKDGINQQLYIVQARPETVRSQESSQVVRRFQLKAGAAQSPKVLLEGRAVGNGIANGTVRIVEDLAEMDRVQSGDVLVTDMTDPDWEPVMKRAAAIVTNRGGRTCHAAIIARELGIPAVVGSGTATEDLSDASAVTVSCAEGDTALVYDGLLEYEVIETKTGTLPELPTHIMMNVGNPERAFTFAQISNQGVGLARLEFIISNTIGIHPNAALAYNNTPNELSDKDQQAIRKRSAGYPDPVSFYRSKLVEGLSTIAAAFHPKPVIVRLSDFKTNEYASLIGGAAYEPEEENPMIGFRGAGRYLDAGFQPAFALECEALKTVREGMGLDNIEIMIPFVRTETQLKDVIDLLARHGLKRGQHGLRIIMMCEVPANALLAEDFLQHVDGYSIGSNDLTQLTLALDRDSGLVADLFDERDPAVKFMLERAIQACRKANKYVGICGQGPSDHPDLAKWLMEQGISSISLNPDSVLDTWQYLGQQQ